jgi:hypothetical protein
MICEVQPVCAANVQLICAANVQLICAANVQLICAANVQLICAANVQLICAARFRCVRPQAVSSSRTGLARGKHCRCGCAAGPTTGCTRTDVVVDGNAECDVQGIDQGQRPLYRIPLTVEAIAAMGRALSNHN